MASVTGGRQYVALMRRPLAALVAVLALSTLVACGDDDSDSEDATAEEPAGGDALSKDELIEQGDAVCADLEAATAAIALPDGVEDYDDYISEVIAAGESAYDDFAALAPPEDGEAVHQALLTSLGDAIEAAEGAVAALQSEDTVTAEDLMAEADRLGDAADEEARAYGFQQCGAEDAEDADAVKGNSGGRGG